MGEIGRDRNEYLYEMSYCDIILIIRGYRRRNILSLQLQRLTAYAAFHVISGDKDHKGPGGWLPLYLDKYLDSSGPPLSEQQQQEMLAEMAAINAEIESRDA
ncbi:MAG: hypothetical protein II240_05425 [Bacteroidaceae bacterium]|nr:hypothetical protein [Bacteroidaceae bacterium]